MLDCSYNFSVMKTIKQAPINKKWFIISGVAIICFILSFFMISSCGGKEELTEEELRTRLTAIQDSYEKAQRAIVTESGNVAQWFYNYKNKTEALADELTGWRIKWVWITENQAEFQAEVNKTVNQHLFTENQANQMLATSLAKGLIDIQNIEDEMALKLGVPCSARTTQHKKIDNKLALTDVKGIDDALLKSVYAELVAIVGAEVATKIVLSAGILGTGTSLSCATFGVSVAVALIVDTIVCWFIDTSADIKYQLDQKINKTGADTQKIYQEVMTTLLKARRAEWEKQLLHF